MHNYIKWFELAAALAAIINWRQVRKDIFLKHLAFLIFFVASAEFAGYLIKFEKKFNVLYYNFFVNPGIFILYTLAFYKGFWLRKNQIFAVMGSYIVIIIFQATIYFFDPARLLNPVGYIAGALFVSIMALLKLIEMIRHGKEIDFFRNPRFFLMLLISFFYLITIPYYSITFYLYLNRLKSSATALLHTIHTITNYLLYTGFAIIFILWGKQKRGY